uniref:Cysteine-rich motor neuron 1 protein n=1 Tax=Schistocephalus solidus TaxID=70667 RepID=A0A183SRF6_SCHSO
LSCPCGRVVRRARCGERPPSPCGARCTRVYKTPSVCEQTKCAFGGHPCPDVCHFDDCPPCPQLIKAVCYCGRVDELTICGGEKAKRYHLEGVDPLEDDLDACDLACLSEADAAFARPYSALNRALFVGTVFSCEQACGRMLNCRHHRCQALCHPGDCQPCQLLPAFCLTCPCGRVPLSKLTMSGDPHGDRTRCTDPVPVCPNVCDRPNPVCGHPCPAKCHAGECPPCKLTTKITCRCGRSTKEVTCSEFAAQMASSVVLSLQHSVDGEVGGVEVGSVLLESPTR